MLRIGSAAGCGASDPFQNSGPIERVQRSVCHAGRECETAALSHTEKTIPPLGVTLPWVMPAMGAATLRKNHLLRR